MYSKTIYISHIFQLSQITQRTHMEIFLIATITIHRLYDNHPTIRITYRAQTSALQSLKKRPSLLSLRTAYLQDT